MDKEILEEIFDLLRISRNVIRYNKGKMRAADSLLERLEKMLKFLDELEDKGLK